MLHAHLKYFQARVGNAVITWLLGRSCLIGTSLRWPFILGPFRGQRWGHRLTQRSDDDVCVYLGDTLPPSFYVTDVSGFSVLPSVFLLIS